ncbi:MAG TPA: 2-dehydropantoate 2-reductase N-terminal domain-containing protein [Myxococcales bacterium]|nr:2-dehydropantoate 2-reductase N-terminal domain-containing protein [Myxococcales bacterium]
MRTGVIGLGAIGGVTAQRLLGAGLDVALAAGRHAAELSGKFSQARIGETLPGPDPYGLILLCVRSPEIETALRPAVPLLKPDGAVVCLQNGFPEERVAKLVGPQRVLGAVIGWSATMTEPGEYVVTGSGKFTLGGASPRLEHARLVLQHAFPVRVTHNLQGARWSKLAMNCAMSTLGAVSGLSLGEMAARRDVCALALRIIEEVVQVAQARGVRMEPIAGIRPDTLVKLPAPVAHASIWLAAQLRPSQKSGMIARLQQGRPSGVEDLNALIDAPLNRALVRQVQEIEKGQRRISPQNLEELS